jgi:hypothetical protein
MSADEEPEESSPLAGACVLVVLAGVVVGIAFAIDEAVGVLLLVVAGVFALWRSARRKGTDLALPSPTERGPDSDERARRRSAKARVALDPNGVMCIMHAPVEEEVKTDDPTPPRRPRLRVLRRMRVVE